MLQREMCQIFTDAKESSSRHQKLLQKLENIRQKSDEEPFFQEFFRCVEITFHTDVKAAKAEMTRLMTFVVKFCIKRKPPDDNVEMDAFLKRVLFEALKYHNLDYVTGRYRCCQFVTLLLKEIGDEGIDDEAWDAIQTAMLERLQDPKSLIRLQAVTALLRLQEPMNHECPVINAFMTCLQDSNAAVRKAVVENIGPNALTISRIVERLRDVDEHVRAAAFRKCAAISPEYMKISSRQLVLRCGFSERSAAARRTFTEHLLPRWLGIFGDDALLFFRKLNLDADESDLEQTFSVYESLMDAFCKSRTFEEATGNLPMDGGRLVPVEQLSFEVASYWNLLSGFLRRMEQGADEFLQRIVPDLVELCAYIKRVTQEKFSSKMEDYEILVFEYVLYLLFDMVEKYDFGDEMSRKTVRELIVDLLQKRTFHAKLLGKLMGILTLLHNKNAYELTKEITQLVSEIREPFVSVEPSEDERREHDFKLAELKVRLNVLMENRDQAVKNADYMQAHELKEEIARLKEQLEQLESNPLEKAERRKEDGVETTVRCLDILIALMQQPAVNALTPFLQTCKDMYLMPLLAHAHIDIFWRAVKLLVLYCIIDKETMNENSRRIFGALAYHRMTPCYEKNLLFVTIEAVSDLTRIYGPDILQSEEDAATTTTSDETAVSLDQTKRRVGGRKLYNADLNSDFDVEHVGTFTFKDVVDALADFMDDECPEVRLKAGVALINLLQEGLCSSPSLVSRLILKWHTLEYGTKLQQLLGVALVAYAKEAEGSEEVIEKAVVPTLVRIAKAPKSSPLVDVDPDSVTRFLKTITNIKVKQNVLVSAHRNIAETILQRVNSRPQDVSVNLLVKMLTLLQISTFSEVACKELAQQTESVLEVVTDKVSLKHLEKFLNSLKQRCNRNSSDGEPMETITEGDETEEVTKRTESPSSESGNKRQKPDGVLKENTPNKAKRPNKKQNVKEASVQEKTPSVNELQLMVNGNEKAGQKAVVTSSVKRRRRKSRKSSDALSNTSDETILHTIIENTFEQEVLEEDLTIESASSGSNSNKTRNRTVIEETTDSDASQKATFRRSKRKKK